MDTLTITDAQARTIKKAWPLLTEDATGVPQSDILGWFPRRDAEDNGHRRNVWNLMKKGFIVLVWKPDLYQIKGTEIKAAYERWYEKRGYKQSRPSPPPPPSSSTTPAPNATG